MDWTIRVNWGLRGSVPILLLAVAGVITAQPVANICTAQNTVTAHVAALDQPIMYNRLGATQPNGMVFALERDIVPLDNPLDQFGNDVKLLVDPSTLHAGKVRLRSDKRPRPIVLRVNVGSCIQIVFRNLLAPNSERSPITELETTLASIHLMGLDLINSIDSDGSFAGVNSNALVAPDAPARTYTYYAPEEGTFLLYSTGDLENNNNLLTVPGSPQGQMVNGLFGSVTVEPKTAEYYRSQVTREELQSAAYFRDNLPPNMSLTQKLTAAGTRIVAHVRRSMFSQAASDADLTRDVFVLTTIQPERGTFETADVVVSPDGRLYALDYEGDPQAGTHSGHQLINYDAVYPPSDPHGRTCVPILKMKSAPYRVNGSNCEAAPGPESLIYTDLTGMITGPNAGRFPYSENSPSFSENSAEPDRREPYREFTIHYHNPSPVQAFEQFFTPNGASVMGWTQDENNLSSMLGAGQDQFGINYGIAGIGAEVLANRLGVGPMGNPDAVELKFEEFFLTSWAVGDPAMVVDVPANAQNELLRDTPKDPTNPDRPDTYTPGKAKVDNNLLTAELQGFLNDSAQKQVGFSPAVGDKQRATRVYYPDDPSNVYHSYLRDHVKFRILHAGPGATHVHHLHAHQWLHSPNNDDGDYLDSQMLTPGASYTLEIAYGGSGNRNLTIGDSIFHCHFYPHFAAGMWSLWRVHDVLEAGTELDAGGIPKPGINRVLPDGEIRQGTPIPAIVPLPELAMAPIPADVRLTSALADGDNRRIEVIPDRTENNTPVYSNPGYPFFVPGVAGHRAPHPPLDMAWQVDASGKPVLENGKKKPLDGGLPRHLVLDGKIFRQFTTRWDFTKDFVLYNPDKTLKDGFLKAFVLPEDGTAVEKAAMAANSQRTHKTFLPDGDPANWITNGLPPVSGAPFASPGVTEYGDSNVNTRRYLGANIQIDAVLNKKGWHYPQQRMITLWNDVPDTVSGKRAPQPFFFRATTGETVEYWQTNLVPNYYELDDFQVRTPTDIIGQHIHLVKFDVLASDGGSNGFNYEDGTFSPDEVRERIFAINKAGGLYAFDDKARQFFNPSVQTSLTLKKYDEWYKNADGSSTFGPPPAGQNWDGAQTTIQLWDSDPLLNNKGVDRTLRTVFTHDHFGPSTHQQIGLYAGLLIEPENSSWFDPSSGQRYYDSTGCYNPTTGTYQAVRGACPPGTFRRLDGGPTGWSADIHTANTKDSYREFALEFQDLQLAYGPASTPVRTLPQSSVFTGTVSSTTVAALAKGSVTDELRQVFAASGVTLTKSATAKTSTTCPNIQQGPDVKWIVHDPAPPDADEDYCLADRHFTTVSINGPVGATQRQTYTPALRPQTITVLNQSGAISGSSATDLYADLQSFGIIESSNDTASAAKKACQFGNTKGQWIVTVTYVPPSPSTGTSQWCVASNPGFTSISVLMPDMELGWQDPDNALQAPSAASPLFNGPPAVTVGPPYPTLISSGQNGSYSLNYRNEPLPSRLTSGNQPNSTDLAFAFSSIARNDAAMNCQPIPGNPIGQGCATSPTPTKGFKFPNWLISPSDTSPRGTDPFTPLLRAYQGDKVQIRTLVGAHLTLHSFQMPEISWLFEPGAPNSGYRSVQGMGLSEHFEMLFDLPRTTSSAIAGTNTASTDYVYEASSGPDGLVNGLWGIMRAFDPSKTPTGGYSDLKPLPNNPMPNNAPVPAACTPTKTFNVTALSSSVTYNTRGNLVNSAGILYARSEDVTCTGTSCSLKSGVPVEPLILRANAGDCIAINLTNALNASTLQSKSAASIRNSPFGSAAAGPGVTLQTSSSVGMQPQILWRDPNVLSGLGLNVGFNNQQTLALNAKGTSIWFAGRPDGTPMEGTILLEPVDPIMQHFWGLMGALILEPKGATIAEEANTHAVATITPQCAPPALCQSFRELVVLAQSDVQSRFSWGGMNYRSEPFTTPYRFPNPPSAPAATPRATTTAAAAIQTSGRLRELESRNASASMNSLSPKQGDFQPSGLLEDSSALETLIAPKKGAAAANPIPARYSNTIITTANKDPETPILHVAPGTPVRVRYLYGGGYTTFMASFDIHGHHWEEEPWTHNSTVLGHNPQSQVFGAEQIAPYQTANFLLDMAGGAAMVPGDYIYETFQRNNVGTWGLIRVEGAAVVIHRAQIDDRNPNVASVAGSVSVEPGAEMPAEITVAAAESGDSASCSAKVQPDGAWSCTGPFQKGTTVRAGNYTAVVR